LAQISTGEFVTGKTIQGENGPVAINTTLGWVLSVACTLQVKNGRYEVSLPWREYHDDLPDNYSLS